MHDAEAMPERHDEALDGATLLRAMDLLPDGVLLVDGGRRWVYANPAFLEIWRVPKELVSARNADDTALIPIALAQLEDPDGFLLEVERLYGTPDSSRDELMLKDGRVLQRRSVPSDETGHGRIWVFTDVTEERFSRSDELTGLANRRAYVEEIHRFVGARDDGRWRAVTLMDLDHFKALNDLYGHAAGDEALRRVGAFLTECLRAGDAAYRIGGEEFLVASHHETEQRALDFAERLREGVKGERIENRGNADRGVLTASLGLVAFREAATAERVFEGADAALYRAKRAGRDRVERAAWPPAATQAEGRPGAKADTSRDGAVRRTKPVALPGAPAALATGT